ncbi:MAG: RNA 2',3'-cyclic phosphodiesterase [Burkholderiales bacterium]|nr:RNA 2',3'-cyclic phosphodiesterase [Burkholderiales bacterium]
MATPAPKLRLFLALWPGTAARAALQACRDSIAWPLEARPTADDRLHITLHFLGNVPAERLPPLQAALAVPAARFELHLDRLRPWPGGLVVLQPSTLPPPLMALHAALAAALRGLALPVETRAFRPHLTLARHCREYPPLPRIEALRWAVGEHVLVHSTPDGRYRIVQRYRCA